MKITFFRASLITAILRIFLQSLLVFFLFQDISKLLRVLRGQTLFLFLMNLSRRRMVSADLRSGMKLCVHKLILNRKGQAFTTRMFHFIIGIFIIGISFFV